MEQIILKIEDKKDLVILNTVINTIQSTVRRELANDNTGIDDVENVWLMETVDEFNRLQSIKEQIDTYIKGE